MIAPKVKVGISIFLTEDGNVGFQMTSKNKITLLGMIEIAKSAILSDTSFKQEESLIQPVGIG